LPDVQVITRTFTWNGNYVREMRGLWEVKVDFMGGPFISWTMVDEKRNRIVTAFGFVYAPKIGKRNPDPQGGEPAEDHRFSGLGQVIKQLISKPGMKPCFPDSFLNSPRHPFYSVRRQPILHFPRS
jgi:hypothetical protein